ncbi:hypothetical protein Tco_1376396 [Tanacetum coccineum]
MVAFLTKTKGNEDFADIVDFLNASSIRYSLTVNPTVYVSNIKQFWSTAKTKTANNETQIYAKVAGKSVVVTESSVRSDLQFNDEDGATCLTNVEIFENLALMGYERDSDKLSFEKALFSPHWKYLIHTILHCLSSKSTAWNEFSTNVASAVICLAKGQKFNFSKLIFDGMLRNLDPKSKFFLMYPRFLQLFLNNQIKNLSVLKDIYKQPFLTKKVFANMRRKGKDFSGKNTPLFQNMLAIHAEEGEGSGQPSEPQPTPSPDQSFHEEQLSDIPSSSQPQKTQKHRKGRKLSNRVLDLEKAMTAQAKEIAILKKRVKKLEKRKRSRTQGLKLFKMGTSKRRSLDKEDASKHGRNLNASYPLVHDGVRHQRQNQLFLKMWKNLLRNKGEGKAQWVKKSSPSLKEQQQIPLRFVCMAQRIQEEQEMTEQQKKRQAEVLESAKYYTKEDWDIIRANVESNCKVIQDSSKDKMRLAEETLPQGCGETN